MYIRTFAIGFPIPAFLFSSSPPFSSTPSSPPPLTLASMLAQIVASVGPYALISTRPLLHLFISPRVGASPATTSTPNDSSSSPSPSPSPSPQPPNIPGVTVTCVILSSFTFSLTLFPSTTSSRFTTYHLAPWLSAITVSHTLASKLNDANCSTRLSPLTPNSSACTTARLL